MDNCKKCYKIVLKIIDDNIDQNMRNVSFVIQEFVNLLLIVMCTVMYSRFAGELGRLLADEIARALGTVSLQCN